jgi:hypothetical protein
MRDEREANDALHDFYVTDSGRRQCEAPVDQVASLADHLQFWLAIFVCLFFLAAAVAFGIHYFEASR